jgi:hypothetical protein
MKPFNKSDSESRPPSTCRHRSRTHPITTPAKTTGEAAMTTDTIAAMTAARKAQPPHRKGQHENQDQTITRSSNEKSPKGKDMGTSSTQSSSPKTPKAGQSSRTITPTNPGKPPSACDSSAMESATQNATYRTWTQAKCLQLSKTRLPLV